MNDIVYCTLVLPENEVERIKVVKECQILNSNPHETDFDRYTSLARRIFNVNKFACAHLSMN